jgi:hypothetical protein
MEVQWFLNERTGFIRYYYNGAAEPFLEIQRKIESGEEPYVSKEGPPDDEPPYLEEWGYAADALTLLGRSCVTFLDATMKLYFDTWLHELEIEFKGKKILPNYQPLFEELLGRGWSASGANLAILEQVSLARNNDQHSSKLGSIHAYHQKRDWKKHPDLFFISETDRASLANEEEASLMFMFSNRLEVTRDKLFMAIDEVEKLVEWLEPQLMICKYGNTSGFPVLAKKAPD